MPMETMTSIAIDAEPYLFAFDPPKCALLIINMQRHFLEPGGFGEMLGNDVSQLRRTIEPNRWLLAAWRALGAYTTVRGLGLARLCIFGLVVTICGGCADAARSAWIRENGGLVAADDTSQARV